MILESDLRRKYNGVILLEVMIAVLLLTTGITAALGLHFRSLRSFRSNEKHAKAVLLMESEAAWLYMSDFDSLHNYRKSCHEAEGLYEWHVTISEHALLPLKQVTLLLTWDEKGQVNSWEESLTLCKLSEGNVKDQPGELSR